MHLIVMRILKQRNFGPKKNSPPFCFFKFWGEIYLYLHICLVGVETRALPVLCTKRA